jgi:MarR family transcriptional regulator, organic hydroperoxide resistance regulator
MPVSKDSYCNCLFYSANALARKMTRLADRAFGQTGVAASPAFILMTVNRQPGITAGDIARILQLSPSTVTRLIDKLERDGFVSRRMEGKYMQVTPTQKSMRMDGLLKECWKSLYEDYSSILGEAESRALSATLHAVSAKLD